MKNRRGRQEIGVSRRREGGTEEERDRSTQLSVLKVFSVAQTPKRFTELDWEEKGNGLLFWAPEVRRSWWHF